MLTLAILSLAALIPQDPAAAPRPIFDGATLDGWTTRGGRYDGPALWTVEDGCLVGRTTETGEGGLIYTDRYHHSFDLAFEVKMDWPFDSGVFLRMLPPATTKKGLQVTLDHREGGEIGAIYADGFLRHNEDGASHYKRGEWNHVRVRCTGLRPHVEAWINGTMVTEYELPSSADGYAESGRIGLQVHGGEASKSAVRFRKITLRDLPVFDPAHFTIDDDGALHPESKAWVGLFTGENLASFQAHGGDGSGFAVRDGLLLALTKGQAHELRSVPEFSDFELRLDFRLAPMANSGVFVRAARNDDNPAFSGAEIQILDDWNWEAGTKSELKPWQFTGSLYGAVPPGVKDGLHPIGAWNTLEIRFVGRQLRTRLNGWTLYDIDTSTLVPEEGEPFRKRATGGFIGLQRHPPHDAVEGDAFAWFRNVYVLPIDAGR